MNRMLDRTLAIPFALLLFSCGNPVEPEPEAVPAPVLVSADPVDGTGGITGSTLAIVFTFDQNILCTPEGQKGVSVDGGAFIDRISPSGAEAQTAMHFTLLEMPRWRPQFPNETAPSSERK